MKTILITDSLFVGPEEERQLHAAGFALERLENPDATEDELIVALSGKVGYILRGIESVTDRVIDAADDLRAIALTGSDYVECIPGWRKATQRGISISAATGANSDAVAEYTLTAILMLVRNLPALTTPGGLSFYIAREFGSLTLGIVGFGRIGKAVSSKAIQLGMRVIVTKYGVHSSDVPGIEYRQLDQLLHEADIVSIHVNKARGQQILDRAAIARIRPGSVVVNSAFRDAVDNRALLERVTAGELRAAVDYPLCAPQAPIGTLLASNAYTAFNTVESNTRISTRVARSIINMLLTGDDVDLVNPEYRIAALRRSKISPD